MIPIFPPFYLFLDVDGVLHDRRASAVENFEFADRLGLLLDRYPEVVVVVSSPMGRVGPLANLQGAYGPLLGPRLHDFTPIVKGVIDGVPPFHRFVEIAYWLATHPESRPDTRDARADALARRDWTALDVVDHWFPPECAQLIRVDANLGLADEPARADESVNATRQLVMNDDLERRLKAKHPTLLRALRDRRFRQSIGHYGIECGDRWCALIDDLCTQIDSVVKREGLRYAQVQQVREKLGFLEFYLGMDEESSTVERLIQEARERSAITCEKCGAPGARRTDGWLIVLCDANHEDRVWMGEV